jgi:membrane-associated phospholipid phosphatase
MSAPRLPVALVGLLQKYPWFGWAVWGTVVVAVLLRMHPRRFGAAFKYYINFAVKLWTEQTVYDPSTLGDVSYWPTSLLLMVPLLPLGHTAAAAVAFAIFAGC